MIKFLKPTVCAATLAASLLLPTFRVSAQDDAAPAAAPAASPSVSAPAPPPPGGPGGGMEQFRQRINERLKTALKATDDEWSVIQPLLEKVQDKQRDVLMNRFGGMMGRGGPGGPGGEGRRQRNNGGENAAASPSPGANGQNGGNNRRRDPRPVSSEAQALETALQDDNTNVNDVKTKLAALRAERTKANADLASAREDLKKVLNMRQEAVLVLAGMLD